MDFLSFLTRRLLQIVPVLFGIVLVVFLVIRMIPGDPARIMLGVNATEERLAALRAQLGLDQPIWVQLFTFFADVTRGELGISLVFRRPVIDVIFERLPPTLFLISYAVLMSLAVCVPLAMLAATRRGRAADQVIRGGATLTLAMPSFWLGLNLLIVFAVLFPLFPVAGYGRSVGERLWHLFLPALTITLSLAPILIRTLRSSIIQAMNAPHVEFARTKGLPHRKLLRRHVLRNGLMATVTILGVNIGWLLGGSVVIENVFSIPGLGSLIISSVAARDYPMIQGIALVFGLMVICINLVTDIVYALLDPRVSYD